MGMMMIAVKSFISDVFSYYSKEIDHPDSLVRGLLHRVVGSTLLPTVIVGYQKI